MASKYKHKPRQHISSRREKIKYTKTGEDRSQELKNPHSKAYQEEMNKKWFNEMVMDIIREKSIRMYLYEKFLEKRLEEEAILESRIQKSAVMYDKLKNAKEAHPHKLFEDLKRYDKELLKTLYFKSLANLENLQRKSVEIDARLENLHQQEQANLEAWRTEVDNSINEFRDFLRHESEENHFIRVPDAAGVFHNVDIDSEEFNDITESAFALPTPAEAIRVLSQVSVQHPIEPTQQDNQVPHEDKVILVELPPNFALMVAIGIQIRALGKASTLLKGVDSSAVPSAIEPNQDILKNISEKAVGIVKCYENERVIKNNESLAKNEKKKCQRDFQRVKKQTEWLENLADIPDENELRARNTFTKS